MLEIVLQDIICQKNKVSFEYTIPEEYIQFIRKEKKFYYEYLTDIDFVDVPKSILVIPFVMNFMPLIWVSGGTLIVEELDKSFYESLDLVLEGIERVYPDVEFNGQLKVQRIIENQYTPNDNEKTVLFSGGVDAVSTLISHIDENPMLINIWGADVDPDDIENHRGIESDLTEFVAATNMRYFFIKSSLRWCFDEAYLSKYWRPVIKDTWWHGMQHSIGLLALLAPYDYLHKVKVNYIASTYMEKDIGTVRCVSYPFIDSVLKLASTQCYHDGFEYSRLQKIKNIVDYTEQNKLVSEVPLKVCFHLKQGKNCCSCEKCLRTMCGILALGGGLENYGFYPGYKEAEAFIKQYCDQNILESSALCFWTEIRDYVNRYGTPNKKMEWLKNYQFNQYKPKWYKRLLKKPTALLRRVKRYFLNLHSR